MFDMFKSRRAASGAAASKGDPVAMAPLSAAPAPLGQAADLTAAIASIGRQASTMGREAAEVRGQIEDMNKASSQQLQTLGVLADQVHEITRAQDHISAVSNGSLGAVERARGAVEKIGAEVGCIVTSLKDVSLAASTITQIALQTRLVAFNASVEAKRAGDAGRGFGVVADAVKDLAAKVEESSKDIMGTVAELDERIAGLAREISRQEGSAQTGAFHKALADVEQSVSSVTAAAAQSRGICAGLNAQMATTQTEMKRTVQTLGSTLKRSEVFLDVSEDLIELLANSGIESEDTPFIEGAIEAAGLVSKLLDDALSTRTIADADLFDENYQPIPGTNPQQHTTRFVELADRLFPQVQERMLGLSEKVVFCIAVDRNGYVATHNKIYCNPQRGDLVWDSANSRYRRIFNDRTGLASGRNERPFLLQTYRRDMGGGQFVVMKEAAAPITVNGRHWGGLRLAFRF
jgi:methyl-accepting chemotaxis protein